MLSSLGTNFVILKHNTQNLLEKARLYNELAAWFQRGNICEDIGDKVKSRVSLEVLKHAKYVFQNHTLSFAITKKVRLAIFSCGEIGEEHECTLDRA